MRPSPQRLSLRGRLLTGMVLLVGTGLAVANVSGILLLRNSLEHRVDEQLNAIGAPVGPQQSPLPPAADPCSNPRDPQGLRSDFLIVVLDAVGKQVCVLGPTDVSAPLVPAITPGEAAAEPGIRTLVSADGSQRWRVRLDAKPEEDRTVVLAVSLGEADATVRRLQTISLATSLVVLLLLGAAAWFITRIGLRPLEEIERTAERIAAGDLSERVPVYRRGTEVGRLSHALNGMLGQIEGAFSERTRSEEKLRRFIADASHELRTPVATIRGHAELYRTGVVREPARVDSLMLRVESEAIRMGDLVDDLLLLARLDQARPLELHPVDLLTLATDAVVDAQARQPERSIDLDVIHGPDPLVVVGDQARLRQVVTNLVTNALRHTPSSSAVRVRLRAADDQVILAVIDQGPGIPPDVVPRVFDRFYRRDSGRARDHGGTGLGLAIVSSLVAAHGGTVTCTSSETAGSTFEVRLPLARTSA